jgi:uncharacterized paraquat-inducible protein A
MKKETFKMLCIATIIIFMLFVWAIDIAASAMIISGQAGINITLMNMVWNEVNPNIMYHASLVILIGIFASVIFLLMQYYDEVEIYKEYLEGKR